MFEDGEIPKSALPSRKLEEKEDREIAGEDR